MRSGNSECESRDLIAFNNDVADAWQWADEPRYPGDLANLALRLGMNVAMYAMTH